MSEELTRDSLAETIDSLRDQLNDLTGLLDAHDSLSELESNPERLMLLRIATRLNLPTVQQLTDQVSEDELKELKALAVLDGWFDFAPAVEVQPVEMAPPRRPGMLTPDEALRHFEKAG